MLNARGSPMARCDDSGQRCKGCARPLLAEASPVLAWIEKVYPDVGAQQHGEKSDRQARCPASAKPYGQTRLKQRRVKQPQDERPRFDRLPRPKPAPGRGSPHRAAHDRQTQQNKAASKKLIINPVELFQIRQPALWNLQWPLSFKAGLLNEIKKTDACGDNEKRFAQKSERHVHRKPCTS